MGDDAAGGREAGGCGAGLFGPVGVDDEGGIARFGAVLLAGAGAEGGDAAQHGAAGVVRLHDPDILDAENLGDEGRAEADGPTTEDDEADIGYGAHEALGGEADGVPTTGQRLGEGSMGEGDTVGDGDEITLRDGETLGESALSRGDGDERTVGAQVLAPLNAVDAGTACDHGVHGDALALHGAG